MERFLKLLAWPLKVATAFVRITGRITVGAVGFVIMGAGLALADLAGLWYFGIPIFFVGLILLVKAIF